MSSAATTEPSALRLASRSGLSAELNANGSLRRLDCGPLSLALFPGNELEGGPANLYLRRRGGSPAWTPLLGPRSPTRFGNDGERLIGAGHWQELRYAISLQLPHAAPVWLWHVQLENLGQQTLELDLTYAQDLALAPYGAVRLNEFYVSQYVDHTPLRHARYGTVLASRQNQAADGRYPWSLIGALRQGVSFATDALQFHGLEGRRGSGPLGLDGELAGERLQHEHSMVVIRDAPLRLEPGARATAGFFGLFVADHPAATSEADLEQLTALASALEATPEPWPPEPQPAATPSDPAVPAAATLFSAAPLLESLAPDRGWLQQHFGGA